MPAPLIADLEAREILDSRGNPTIEVDCILSDGTMGRASVPSGASTGKYEACELRDGDPKRYGGQGVLKAVKNVNTTIRRRLVGMIATNQYRIDQALIDLDPTPNKRRLGANASLGASLAVCRAASITAGICVYRFLGGAGTMVLPTPLLNVINGGAHASNNLDVQEYMIVPGGFQTFRESLRAASETYHHLRLLLHDAGKSVAVGDEGGFAPLFRDNEEPLDFIVKAIKKAGYRPGDQIGIALDVAASELHKQGGYWIRKRGDSRTTRRTSDQVVELYSEWLDCYPIVAIEDGLAEDDWSGWRKLTKRLGTRVQLLGDDIFVTNTARLKRGIREGVANAVIVKPNQVGTVSETLDCVRLANDNGYGSLIANRSGETTDHFIADLAVAVNSGEIKTGAPCRGERVAKYNRLLRIEEDDVLRYAGFKPFSR